MFRRRYHVQACDLDTAVSKSQVKWFVVSKAWTLKTAKSRAAFIQTANSHCVIRVLDTRTGRPVA